MMFRRLSAYQVIEVLLAAAVAGIFIYASYLKIIEPEEFARSIRNYKILPIPLINLVAIFLPWWEMAAGIAILIPYLRRSASVLTLMMGVMFILAVTSAMVRGLDIECGCFGNKSSRAGLETLLVDAFIVISSSMILVLSKKRPNST